MEAVMNKGTDRETKATGDVVWDIKDRFSAAKAIRIRNAFTGEPTQFAMVYGKDAVEDAFTAMRPVSDKYKPITTESVVEAALGSLGQKGLEINPRVEDHGTRMVVSLDRTNKKFEVGTGKPFDLGHPWSRDINRVHGTAPTRDVVIPRIDIANSYTGATRLNVTVGLFRLICENGATIMLAGMKISTMHTGEGAARVIAEAEHKALTFDFSRLSESTRTRIEADQMKKITEYLPERIHKDFREYTALQNDSAWATLNGLSYLTSHHYKLSSHGNMNKAMSLVFKSM